jgi:hypothetical protein
MKMLLSRHEPDQGEVPSAPVFVGGNGPAALSAGG